MASSGERWFTAIYDQPHIKGVKIHYFWAWLEPSEGVYDFSIIEANLAELARHNKRLVIEVTWQGSYHMSGLCAPQYVYDQDAVFCWFGGDKCVAAMWRPWIAERYGKLLEALGQRFNDEPYVEGLMLGEETSLGSCPAPDVTVENVLAGLCSNFDAAKAAFPNKVIMQKSNYLGGSQSAMDEMIAYAQEVGMGIGGTDLRTGRPTHSQLRHKDYAGLIPLSVDNERPNTSPGSTVEAAFQWAVNDPDGLHANYIFWSRGGTGEWDFVSGILPVINAHEGAINEALPFNLAGCSVRVAASADDAEQRLDTGAVDLDSTDLELVRDDGGAGAQLIGLRFAHVPIPAGSRIDAAWLTFKTDETSSEPTSLQIAGEDSDDAAPFAAVPRNIGDRPLTAARATWTPEAWTSVSGTHTSADIATVLVEIVARPGWQVSNAMALIISGSGKRVAESYDGDRAGAPALHVSFAPPAPSMAPYSVAADALSGSTIRLTWRHGEPAAESFKIDRRQSETATWVRVATVAAEASAYDDTGLAEGTKFYYKLKASNAMGDSAYSLLADATTPLLPPAAPSDLCVWAESSSAIALSWLDRSGNEEFFKIDRRRSGLTTWQRIATLGADSSAYRDERLPPATKFYYKVKAWNDMGNSPYTPIASATTPDGVPLAVTWRYRRGTAEASAPPAAWRLPGFDASDWAQGPAPFGYGDGPYGTELSDMRGAYTCVFMRHPFEVANPAAIAELRLNALYDDGFVAWINGEEVARRNVGGVPGSSTPYSATASTSVGGAVAWSVSLTGAALPALRAGENVVALQVYNASLAGSSDLTAEAQLSLVMGHWPVAEDADQDAMPDDWAAAHLSALSDPTAVSALSDPDGDGLCNLEEYIAGTDPIDETENWRLESALQNGQVTVRFETVMASGPGYAGRVRHYALERRPFDGVYWQPVPGYENIAATGAPVVFLGAGALDGCAYRARVWLQGP
ncbi:MAG: fibronectin type III domain-containing protein [Kiritimatiellae bacterium]|nr:fibronectin type III domain-containing protein [Kiritimatiellia bacterium]